MASSHAPMNEAKRCLEDDPDCLPSPKRYSPHPACAPRLDAAALTCLLPAVHPLDMPALSRTSHLFHCNVAAANEARRRAARRTLRQLGYDDARLARCVRARRAARARGESLSRLGFFCERRFAF